MTPKEEKIAQLNKLISENKITTIRGLNKESGIALQTIQNYKKEGLLFFPKNTEEKGEVEQKLEQQNTVPLSKYEELEEEFYSLSLIKIEMEERLTNSELRNKTLEEENKNLKWKIYVLDSEPSESNNELEEARQLNRKYLEEITSLNKQIEQLNEKYKLF